MKTTTLIAALTVCGAVAVNAQEQTITTKPIIIEPVKPQANEVVTEKARYSGALVHATKAENPVQLINPAAPAEYGPAEQNVTRDPMSGKVDGLKLFSFSLRPKEKRVPKVTPAKPGESVPVAVKTSSETPKAVKKK